MNGRFSSSRRRLNHLDSLLTSSEQLEEQRRLRGQGSGVTDLLGVDGHVEDRSFVVEQRILRYGEDALAGVDHLQNLPLFCRKKTPSQRKPGLISRSADPQISSAEPVLLSLSLSLWTWTSTRGCCSGSVCDPLTLIPAADPEEFSSGGRLRNPAQPAETLQTQTELVFYLSEPELS